MKLAVWILITLLFIVISTQSQFQTTPTFKELKALKSIRGKIPGTIVWSTTRHGTSEIYKMKADGTDKVRLTNDEKTNYHPVWSKDGKWIYYQRNYDIHRMHPDGSNSQIVVKNGCHFDITWDNLKIVYAIREPNRASIELRDLEKGTIEEIIPARVPEFRGKDLANTTISPDGKWLAFASDYPSAWSIHVVELNGRNRFRYANGCQPQYRPDGSWLVWSLGGYHFIYIGKPDGKNQKLFENSIPGRKHYYFPRWSNNGEYILFAASPHHNWNSDYEIYIKSFNGGEAVRLTFHPGSDIWPDLFIPVERRNAMR